MCYYFQWQKGKDFLRTTFCGDSISKVLISHKVTTIRCHSISLYSGTVADFCSVITFLVKSNMAARLPQLPDQQKFNIIRLIGILEIVDAYSEEKTKLLFTIIIYERLGNCARNCNRKYTHITTGY